MSHKIDAIFLDTGNTMRVVVKDAAFQYRARQKLVKMIGVEESPDAFCEKMSERYEAYKKWAKETQIQLPEQDLWIRWMLPDFPDEKIKPIAGPLTRLWIDQGGRRVPRPDVRQTVKELHGRGYQLGIIANSISETEIPEWLETDGLAGYFKTLLLSSKFGFRKPNPEVYLEAARLIGVEPARCAYVGDNPTRDIQGARAVGYGMVIILLEEATLQKEPPRGRNKPDGIIRSCIDLLNFFPPRDLPGSN